MYGPPPNCKKNRYQRETVCENVSGLKWRIEEKRILNFHAKAPLR